MYLLRERLHFVLYTFAERGLKISRRQFSVVVLFKQLEMETSFLTPVWRNGELFYVGNFCFKMPIGDWERYHLVGLSFHPFSTHKT